MFKKMKTSQIYFELDKKKSKPTKIESMLEVRPLCCRRRFGQSNHFNSIRIRIKIIRFSSNKVLVMDLRFS